MSDQRCGKRETGCSGPGPPGTTSLASRFGRLPASLGSLAALQRQLSQREAVHKRSAAGSGSRPFLVRPAHLPPSCGSLLCAASCQHRAGRSPQAGAELPPRRPAGFLPAYRRWRARRHPLVPDPPSYRKQGQAHRPCACYPAGQPPWQCSSASRRWRCWRRRSLPPGERPGLPVGHRQAAHVLWLRLPAHLLGRLPLCAAALRVPCAVHGPARRILSECSCPRPLPLPLRAAAAPWRPASGGGSRARGAAPGTTSSAA